MIIGFGSGLGFHLEYSSVCDGMKTEKNGKTMKICLIFIGHFVSKHQKI